MGSNVKTVVVIRRQDRIDYVINGICDYYKIQREDLQRRARTPRKVKRKQVTVKMLRDVADISFKEIKNALNNQSESQIWQIYTNITEDIETKCDATKAIREEYQNVLKHLNL